MFLTYIHLRCLTYFIFADLIYLSFVASVVAENNRVKPADSRKTRLVDCDREFRSKYRARGILNGGASGAPPREDAENGGQINFKKFQTAQREHVTILSAQ
jgi:hypothetical protein